MSNKTITLYHGTIYEFDEIDVTKGKPFKDFGIGFYTSQEESHAERLALRNKQIEERRLTKYGKPRTITPWLYTYEFDLRGMGELKVKDFATADRDWVEFIVKNRLSSKREHDYDIIMGPTANDNTNATIDLFIIGTYGDPKSDFAINTFLGLILPEVLPRQMYFGSTQAAALLKPKGRREVW
jgi:hypothetical protein